MIPKPITKSGASLLPTSLVKDVPHASRGTSAAMVATLFYRTGDYPDEAARDVPGGVYGGGWTSGRTGSRGPFVGIGAILCIAAEAGAAGALNMWYDADVDALMSRTAARPILRGPVASRAAVPTANQTRAYWGCSPPRIGRHRMRPAASAERDIGASLFK